MRASSTVGHNILDTRLKKAGAEVRTWAASNILYN